MPPAIANAVWTEDEFAAQIDALAGDQNGSGRLAALLREDHPVYEQRSAAAIVRMRVWVLLALARIGVQDDTLLFVLEELENGLDPYLVAAAARALRSYPAGSAAFAPFVVRALANTMGRNDPVCFEQYGQYLLSTDSGTSPIRELLDTLKWLGPAARGVLPEIEAMRTAALPARLLREFNETIEGICADRGESDCCCDLPAGLRRVVTWSRRTFRFGKRIIFEDQDGASIGFDEVFSGSPTIVVFFYTRCDNPLKCSLTIAKLGRVQKLLQERGLAGCIRTAAITYDPAFDLPSRMRAFGERRGVAFNASSRMLRAVVGMNSLRRRFQLGVNFVRSVVNRHRIEAYILDDRGRVAYSFERLQWTEAELVDRGVTLLQPARTSIGPAPAAGAIGTIAATGLAVFPKCPACWAAYLSMLGIAGLERIPYSPWIEPALAGVALINLAGVWIRARSTRRMAGAWLVAAGGVMIVVSRFGWPLAGYGVAATVAGSVVSALKPYRLHPNDRDADSRGTRTSTRP
jgi:protein SCO1